MMSYFSTPLYQIYLLLFQTYPIFTNSTVFYMLPQSFFLGEPILINLKAGASHVLLLNLIKITRIVKYYLYLLQ